MELLMKAQKREILNNEVISEVLNLKKEIYYYSGSFDGREFDIIIMLVDYDYNDDDEMYYVYHIYVKNFIDFTLFKEIRVEAGNNFEEEAYYVIKSMIRKDYTTYIQKFNDDILLLDGFTFKKWLNKENDNEIYATDGIYLIKE